MKYFILIAITSTFAMAQFVHAEIPPTMTEQHIDKLNVKQAASENFKRSSCEMKDHVAMNRQGEESDLATPALDDYCYCESNHFACNPNSPPPNCNCVCTKK